MNIKSIRVKASYNFQSVEIEAEFPQGPNAELVERLQKKALEMAVKQAEMSEAKKNEMNFTRQEKKQNFSSNKYANNKFL